MDDSGRILDRAARASRAGRDVLRARGECDWQVDDQRIRATPGTYLFLPPGVPHNIANGSDRPARVLMTVSRPGHERYFEELADAVARGGAADPTKIADLRARYDTDQLSALRN